MGDLGKMSPPPPKKKKEISRPKQKSPSLCIQKIDIHVYITWLYGIGDKNLK